MPAASATHPRNGPGPPPPSPTRHADPCAAPRTPAAAERSATAPMAAQADISLNVSHDASQPGKPARPRSVFRYGFLQTTPRDDALAGRLPFTAIRLGGGLSPPPWQAGSAHEKRGGLLSRPPRDALLSLLRPCRLCPATVREAHDLRRRRARRANPPRARRPIVAGSGMISDIPYRDSSVAAGSLVY